MTRADYGVDSPAIIGGLAAAGALAVVATALFPPGFAHPFRWAIPIIGVYFLQGAVGMLHYSKRGKLSLRDTLLNGIDWCGNESVLDVGCGRGLLLIGAATRLTRYSRLEHRSRIRLRAPAVRRNS